MAQVITFERVTPIARYDSVAWEEARIEESATSVVTSAYSTIDTIDLSTLPGGLDADPLTRPRGTSPLNSRLAPLTFGTGSFSLTAQGTSSAPTAPIQNVNLDADTYASVEELARILKIRAPSAEQSDAMSRVLVVAAGEINAEIDRAGTDDALAGWQLALCAEVNLERAVEHWQQQESPFGLIGLGAELGATTVSRDSWTRHALKLQPLKTQWGMA